MELKNYYEYSEDEKRELLFHWWHYYGETVCSLGVMRRFTKMVYDDVDEMFDIGLFSFIKGQNGKDFIEAIKCGIDDEYREVVRIASTDSEYIGNLEEKKDEFIELLVTSYSLNESLLQENGIEIIDDYKKVNSIKKYEKLPIKTDDNNN